jgi:UDP-N-acetylglucosamine/UDP-N-acetylgalactosamine 4-epimerase
MSSFYETTCRELAQSPRRWLVTGGAGFIGSNLIERLLELGQQVRCLDNFATGRRQNLEHIGADASGRFELMHADIRDLESCRAAVKDVDIVLHQAALGSVPRSVEDPGASHATNVDGFLNVLLSARDAEVKRFVYASSSSVYGDDDSSTKQEDRVGRPLSPYAATKLVNEVYADVFAKTYGLECIGLRYFNVFGRRQDPEGPYAAVIPRWVDALIDGAPCILFGDGEKSRDFCYVDNVIQANLLAAVAGPDAVTARVCNVACGERTTLERLFELLRERVARHFPAAMSRELERRPARKGDIAHSLDDISRAEAVLRYAPSHRIAEGLDHAVDWYVAQRSA